MATLHMGRQLQLGGHVHVVLTHVRTQGDGLVHVNLTKQMAHHSMTANCLQMTLTLISETQEFFQ